VKTLDAKDNGLKEFLSLMEEKLIVYEDGKLYKFFNRSKKTKIETPIEIGHILPSGYRRISVNINGRKNTMLAHRLVYAYFNGLTELPPKLEVNHIDGDKLNNRIENLELITPKENVNHAFNTGIRPLNSGEHNHNSKLKSSEVEEIRRLLQKGDITQTEIAKKFNCNSSTISNIKTNKRWRKPSHD
jgi:predicted XRE-type DNA-binding protein